METEASNNIKGQKGRGWWPSKRRPIILFPWKWERLYRA